MREINEWERERMKIAKVLSIYSNTDMIGDAFFNGDELITIIDGNDGCYRSEYMDCLFKSFGIKVKFLKKLNTKQLKALEETSYYQDSQNYLEEEE